jgi:AcrR family transcriptional regulator
MVATASFEALAFGKSANASLLLTFFHRRRPVPTRIAQLTSRVRKQPRQARSQATVEAILEASAHILGTSGWCDFTTNAVAERAGVSIGSLYQYFPDKAGLIEAVRNRHFDEILTGLHAAGDGPPGKRIGAIVDAMIAAHSHHPGMHRVLMEASRHGDTSAAAHAAFEADHLACYESLVLATNPGLAAADARLRAHVLSAALAGATHDAARRKLLMNPKLRSELIQLVGGLLGIH